MVRARPQLHGEHRQPLLIVDAGSEQPFAGDPYVAQGYTGGALPAVASRGALIGLLYLESDRAPGIFRETDIPLLTLVAAQAILALAHARLLEQAQSRRPRRRVRRLPW